LRIYRPSVGNRKYTLNSKILITLQEKQLTRQDFQGYSFEFWLNDFQSLLRNITFQFWIILATVYKCYHLISTIQDITLEFTEYIFFSISSWNRSRLSGLTVWELYDFHRLGNSFSLPDRFTYIKRRTPPRRYKINL
jgi:hypothetical protein